MIIDNFNRFGSRFTPFETNPVLIINPDAVLSQAVSLQSLETIAGRNTQIIERDRRVNLIQFADGNIP